MTSACLETSYDAFKPYSAFAGGLVFGSGWWIFGDALAYRLAITHLPFSLLFLLPGLVATVCVQGCEATLAWVGAGAPLRGIHAGHHAPPLQQQAGRQGHAP